MKSYKNMFFAVLIGLGALCHSLHGLSDSSVVDSIKACSDLTTSDIDRWKLLWLGSLSGPAASGASVYGMYKAYQVGKELTPSQEKLNNVLGNQIYGLIFRGYKPSESIQNIITSQWTWAGAGALGAGLAAYKVLYPRVQAGVLEKIKKYVVLCGQLAVTQQAYHDDYAFRQALQQPGNTVWVVSSPVAIGYGFKNLIEQGNIALLLLDQLLASSGTIAPQELNTLRNNVMFFKNNAQHNFKFIYTDLQKEKEQRVLARTEYGKELAIQSQEVRLAGQQMKNVTSQWKLLKDITNTAGVVITAIFPKELKAVLKEYGPSAVLMIGAWKGYQWLMPANEQEKSE